MNDPYQVLGLEPGADDQQIRHRYLELVRQHPPDQAPERFAAIREAYEKLRDPATRLKCRLFEIESAGSLTAILGEVSARLRSARIPTDVLLSLAEE